MRTNFFGGVIIESADEAPSEFLYEFEDGELHARIYEAEDTAPGFYFEIVRNDDGEAVVTSDPIFDSAAATRNYLKDYLHDIQEG